LFTNRSEPLLATRVRTLSINFCASSKRRVKGQVLAKALTQAIPYITYLRRLEIIWAKREAGYYDPTVALKIFASPLVALWTRAAPTLRELRADVYIDALSVVAKLDASSAPNLRAIDLRVYGGMVPENTGTAGVKAHLSDIAHSLVLPAAHRLEVLEIYLVFPTCLQYPVVRTGLNVPFSILTATQPPFDDFWELLQANRFPRLSKLGVATPFFDSVCPFVAGLVTACVRHGRLKTLLLEPTFSGSQTGPFIHYLHMIHEHGGRWDGLRALTLFLVDGTYLETMRCPPVGEGDFFASFAGPLLSTSSLQDLSLTGHFMTRGNLRETLQTLHHGGGGDSLRRLAVKVHIVRPSTFDVLSELVPFIESLRLEMIDVRPDGELTPALLSSLQAEVDIRAAELAKQLVRSFIRATWCRTDDRDRCRPSPTTRILGLHTYLAGARSSTSACSCSKCPPADSRRGRCAARRS
jgi:hypothetical protein